MVLRGAFSQVGIGLGLGIPAVIGTGKLMTDQLFGVKPWGPVMLALATLLLALAALLASLKPAPSPAVAGWRSANRPVGVQTIPAGISMMHPDGSARDFGGRCSTG